MTTTTMVDEPGLALALRHGMRTYPTGVVLVAAVVEGRPVGMLANSFISVSLDPPLVSVNFMRTSGTWAELRDVDVWGISVLPDDRPDLLPALSRGADRRFDGIDTAVTGHGAVTVPGAPLVLTVARHADVEAGDHVLALLRVRDIHHDPSRTALVLHARPGPPLSPARGDRP